MPYYPVQIKLTTQTQKDIFVNTLTAMGYSIYCPSTMDSDYFCICPEKKLILGSNSGFYPNDCYGQRFTFATLDQMVDLISAPKSVEVDLNPGAALVTASQVTIGCHTFDYAKIGEIVAAHDKLG